MAELVEVGSNEAPKALGQAEAPVTLADLEARQRPQGLLHVIGGSPLPGSDPAGGAHGSAAGARVAGPAHDTGLPRGAGG